MLLAILIGGAILALALGLNPLTFQKFTAEPEATPAAVATPVVAANTPAASATVAPAGAAAPAVAPTAIPTPAAAAPQAVQTAAPAATSVARSQQPETAATTSAAEPTAQAADPTGVSKDQAEPTPAQAAVSTELAAAIIQGYDNYWSVRVRAMGDPGDTSVDLASVMDGDELAVARKTMSEYQSAGEAYQTSVKHQIWITRATPTEADIVDQYTASTLKIDPTTKDPVEPEPEVEQLTGKFALESIDGSWKVVTESYQ
jgi:hypothetical protein